MAEQSYRIISGINSIEMQHSIEYYVDMSASGTRNVGLQFLCSVIADSAYDRSSIKKNVEQMGFDHWTTRSYDYTDGDHVGYTIAYKDTCGGDRIILVAIRGSAGELKFPDLWNSSADWKSDLFNVGPDSASRHTGFNLAAGEVYNALVDYIDVTAGNVRIVITGHSRGAAVGNLLAADLISKSNVPASRVIAYNFACPNTATHYQYNTVSCPNVFNICNTYDLIPMVPADDWGVLGTNSKPVDVVRFMLALTGTSSWNKYGKNIYFTSGKDLTTINVFECGMIFDFIGRNHIPQTYINWAANQFYN